MCNHGMAITEVTSHSLLCLHICFKKKKYIAGIENTSGKVETLVSSLLILST